MGIVESILGALLTVVASIAGRLLLSLGFGVLTVTGLQSGLSWLKDQVLEKLGDIGGLGGGIGADVLQLLSAAGVGVALSIIFSAWVVKLTMQGLGISGVLSRLTMNAWKG